MVQINDNDSSDLLILSDDTNNNSSEAIIFDEHTTELASDNIISFDENTSKETILDSNSLDLWLGSTDPINIFENKSKNITDDFSLLSDNETPTLIDNSNITDENILSWDLSISEDLSSWTTTDASKIIESQIVETNTDNSFDLLWSTNDLVETKATEDTVNSSFDISNNSSSNVNLWNEIKTIWTMVEILDKAVSELHSRSEVIENDIESDENHIKDLKSQITNLESEVLSTEDHANKLREEDSLINKNIKSIEKMKNAEAQVKKSA